MLGLIISMEDGGKLSLEQIRCFCTAARRWYSRLATGASLCVGAADFAGAGLRAIEESGQGPSARLHGEDDLIEPGAGCAVDRRVSQQ